MDTLSPPANQHSRTTGEVLTAATVGLMLGVGAYYMGARLLRGMEDLDLLHAPATPIVSNGEKVVVAQNVRGVFEYQVTPLASNRGQVLELRVATFSDSSGVSYRIIEGSELHDPSLPRKEGGYQPSFDSGDQVLVSELNQVDGLGRFYKDQPHFANSQDPQK